MQIQLHIKASEFDKFSARKDFQNQFLEDIIPYNWLL